MAPSPTRLITPAVGGGGPSVTTAAFSPLANEDVIVCCFVRTNTTVSFPAIANNAGLSFALLGSVAAEPLVRQRLWRVNVGASPPSSMTVTCSATGTPLAMILTVMGQSGSSGDYSNIGSANGAVGDLTVILPVAPATDSIVIGCFGYTRDSALAAGPAGHTLLSSIPGGVSARSWVGYDPAPASDSAFYDTSFSDRRSVAHLLEVKSVPAESGSITVPLALSTSFAGQLAAGRTQAVTMALDMTMTGSIATVGSPENPAGTWRSAVRTWAMPSGVDPIAGDNLTFSSGSTDPPSGFVVVADLIGLTRPSAQIIRPTSAQLFNDEPGNTNTSENQNFNNITGFTTTTNLTLDLRGKKFYHHSTTAYTGDGGTPAARSVLRPDNYRNGLCIYGAEIIGEQIDNTVWRTMKFQTPPNPLNMDDNAIDFQDGGVAAGSTIYVEACVLRKSFDGVNGDSAAVNSTTKLTLIVRGCYAEKMRDEFIENDGLSKLEIYDCLVDSCHNFVSMRPSGSGIPPDYSNSANWVKCYNVLSRCRGQYYTTDVGGDTFPFGTKRDPQWEPTNGSIFVANPTTYGPGWVHREPWKGDFVETFTDLNSTIWVDCRDSIFAFESLPTSRKVVFPPGTYDNVFLLYLPDLAQGFTINDLVDSRYVQDRGITVLSGAEARTLWNTERQNWITAHGGTVVGGLLTFPFTQAPTSTNFLPEDPVTKRASYGPGSPLGGRLLYVRQGGSGHSITDPSGGGNFKTTLDNSVDGDRIIVKPGDYSGFTSTAPTGQIGRIQILAQNPAFSDLNLNYNGGMVGYSQAAAEAGSHSVITGAIIFLEFSELWIEGFRLGSTDPESTTGFGSAQIAISDTPRNASKYSWSVKNYCKDGPATGGVRFGGTNRRCVHYRNMHVGRAMSGGGWKSDYHLFVEEVDKVWVVENFIDGGHNQAFSAKKDINEIYVHGNTFKSTYHRPGDGATGGSQCLIGQQADNPSNPEHCAMAIVSYNKFMKEGNGACTTLSNVLNATVEFNEYNNTSGGATCPISFDALVGKLEPGTPDPIVLAPHPNQWTWRNNTILTPSDFRPNFGSTHVKIAVQRTRVRIENNTASTNMSSTSIVDGGFKGGADYQANAKLLVTFGPNSKVNPPTTGNGIDIE